MSTTVERLGGVELACPACAGPVTRGDGELACARCGRRYPVVAGIPDLRLSRPDPEDLERARDLAARSDELDFRGLLAEHWRQSGKPAELTERFIAGDLATIERSRVYLEEIERRRGARLGPGDRFLELGCGTAGMSFVASGRGASAIATDISMRWLVLARQRLAEAGVESVALACCGAEDPPFAPGAFDVVAASDVIEHVGSQPGFAAGCARALRAGGMLFLATPNRFSLGLEPHVRLWGVGWLPRRLAPRYVRALRRTPYDHVRLLSARGLRNLLAAHGFRTEVEAPAIPPATQSLYSGIELALVRAYNRARRWAPVRPLLLLVGPFFHVFAFNEGAD